jgi:hypothetical protein
LIEIKRNGHIDRVIHESMSDRSLGRAADAGVHGNEPQAG